MNNWPLTDPAAFSTTVTLVSPLSSMFFRRIERFSGMGSTAMTLPASPTHRDSRIVRAAFDHHRAGPHKMVLHKGHLITGIVPKVVPALAGHTTDVEAVRLAGDHPIDDGGAEVE
jgi:hypothetical protein